MGKIRSEAEMDGVREEGAVLKTRDEDVGRGYELWEALHRHGLVAGFSDLSDELCIRRQDLLKR
jgi:hypothetical protein